MLTLVTKRRIYFSLVQHGHRPISATRTQDGFTIRGSPMTNLIEVKLPKYTIAPLERNAPDYWVATSEGQVAEEEHHRLLGRTESTLSMVEEGRVRGFLRGGSWRTFHWKRLMVGRKLYRIQYEDELREPPAEIDFSDLVHFLLDWGAVPDSMGWEKLKSSGPWTPAGTILLKKADSEAGEPRKHVDWVLRTSMPDESDGILSLTVKWSKDTSSVSDVRGAASLPPGWGRLKQPALLEASEKRKEEEHDLPARIDQMKAANKRQPGAKALLGAKNVETGSICEPFRTFERSTACLWFTCAASAVLSRKQASGGMWAFEMPADIQTFVCRDSIPCGVMVLLGLMDETEAPQWSSESESASRDAATNMSQRHLQRFQARQAAERLEATMPPEQARIHKMNREAAERMATYDDMRASLAARQERDQRRMQEAVVSPRMSTKAVAEACLVWLIEHGQVGREWTLDQLAEVVLYLMVVDQSQSDEGEARKIAKILDEWMSWTTAGGMKMVQVNWLYENKLAFCFAAALVAVVHESMNSTAGRNKAGADMLECLRLWRKVRLG
ncbi:hypothetical protein A1O1_07336 [Capronia coronata CBS 617.96]|uniref:Uncharacterized protein n=1 Tax=Capronia coronata CBS 617.96 TaxID=1182541 RepID=W9Y387_9EURO|nr:uncharacterized protein A1O1_07336 [Capronia coronata CBS 617.96]EXJ83711.1 hypothetical protein A1O1_07336 [Capronia coronata CBS 617.96]